MNAIDEYGKILPLHRAVIKGDVALTGFYVKSYFADLNVKDMAGRTPLHYAVSNNHCRIVKMLLYHGAKINDITSSKLSPLHIAVSNRRRNIFELLMKHRAEVNPEENFQDKTPLFMAVEYGCVDFVRSLLNRGASIEKATLRGTTLLHVAVRLAHTEMVHLVLEYSTMDLLRTKSNLEGKTAMELARDLQNYKIANLIEQKSDDLKINPAKKIRVRSHKRTDALRSLLRSDSWFYVRIT